MEFTDLQVYRTGYRSCQLFVASLSNLLLQTYQNLVFFIQTIIYILLSDHIKISGFNIHLKKAKTYRLKRYVKITKMEILIKKISG